MILLDCMCDKCKNRTEKINRWTLACKAFPNGIPTDVLFFSDPSSAPECNNGIKFEEKTK